MCQLDQTHLTSLYLSGRYGFDQMRRQFSAMHSNWLKSDSDKVYYNWLKSDSDTIHNNLLESDSDAMLSKQ